MNEYTNEFNKIFYYLKETLKNYNNKILTNNNVANPFSNNAYKKIIAKLSNIQSDQEYLEIINDFIISIHQGHVFLSSNINKIDKIIPLCIQYKDDKYYVVKATNQELEGKEIIGIDNIKMDEYILKLKGSYSFENNKFFIKNLILPSQNAKNISFNNGEITIESVKSEDFYNEIFKRDNPYNNNIMFDIVNGIPYLRINSFSNEMLHFKENHNFFDKKITDPIEYLKEIANFLNSNNASDLIIDIRGNQGGSDEWFELLSMFSNKDYKYTYSVESTIGNLSNGETNEIMNSQGEDINAALKRLQNNADKLNCSISIGNGNSTIKNRYLFINSANYSTSDTLAKFSNKTGFATTIGNHTSGDGFGITPYSFTSNILKRNNAKIVIPSTFYKLEEFQTEPNIKIKDDLLMPYEYGTYKDNELILATKIIEAIKIKQLQSDISNVFVDYQSSSHKPKR